MKISLFKRVIPAITLFAAASAPFAIQAASPNFFGDGSALALDIAGKADWVANPPANLNFNYSSITVHAGAIWHVPSGLVLRSTGNVTILGQVVVVPNVGCGPSIASSEPWNNKNVTVGSGPAAAASLVSVSPFQGGCSAANTWYGIMPLPGGGCCGAGVWPLIAGMPGGGSITILAGGSVMVSSAGSLHADGPAGVGGNPVSYGGGGGGLILIASQTGISSQGLVTAKGGRGQDDCPQCVDPDIPPGPGGGGGGGLLKLIAPVINLTPAADVSGGVVGSGNAGYCYSSGGSTVGNGGHDVAGNLALCNGQPGLVYQRVTANVAGEL